MLARVSKRAMRILKRMNPQDREDVIHDALAWCWENRTNYDPSVPLELWFLGAVKNAKRVFHRKNRDEAIAASSIELSVPDNTVKIVEQMQLAERLVSVLTDQEQKAAVMLARGYSRSEIRQRMAIDDHKLTTLRRQLVPLMPSRDAPRALWAARRNAVSGLDMQLAQEIKNLEFPPSHGKECPPCWRCKWFEGFLPPDVLTVRMDVVEPDVREAIASTEARKIAIAYEVRGET